MKKLFLFLLLAPLFAQAQLPDSAIITGSTPFTPQFRSKGTNASGAQIQFYNSVIGKYFGLYSAYQQDQRYVTLNTNQISPGITSSKLFARKQYFNAPLTSPSTGEAVIGIEGNFSGQIGSAPGFLIDGNRNASPSTGVQGLFNFRYNGAPQIRGYNVGGFASVGGVNVGSFDSLATPGLKLSYASTTGLLKIGTDKLVVPAIAGTDYFALPSLTNQSVIFSNGTTLAQDNTNFFYNNSTKLFTIGSVTAPGTAGISVLSTGGYGSSFSSAGMGLSQGTTSFQQLISSEEARISNVTQYKLVYGSTNVVTGNPFQYAQNIGIGVSPTSKFHIQNNALGTTGNLNQSGMFLQNSTPATSVLNQNSPSVTIGGNIWDIGTSSSKDLRYAYDVEGFSGDINLGALVFKRSVDGGATFLEVFRRDATTLSVQGAINATAGISGGALSAPQLAVSQMGVFGSGTNARTALIGMQSTTKGFLLPRLLTTEVTALGPSSGGALVQAVGVNIQGSGYTTATISFTGGGSPTTNAAATAVISGGKIVAINMTNEGAGYSSIPTVVITGDGTGATATAYSVALGLQVHDREKQRPSVYTTTGWKDIAYTSEIPTMTKYTASGTGSATTISIPHGLSGVTTASNVIVQALNSASAGVTYVTIDATNVNVNYTVAPVTGTNNLSYTIQIKP